MFVKIRKSHRVFFSSAVRCSHHEFSPEANWRAFGPAGGGGGCGFNFELSASIEGSPDPETGWILSEEDFDAMLREVVQDWDHSFLNDSEPKFKALNPTPENMVSELFRRIDQRVGKLRPALQLVGTRLRQDKNLWVGCEGSGFPLLLTQAFRIQCVHRHHNPDLSMEENRRLYNKCASMHGHEYTIEVTAQGEVDSETGLVMKRDEFQQDVERVLIKPFNQTFLNEIVGNTSGEILTEKWSQLMRQAWGDKFAFLVVRETRKNSFVEATNGRERALLLL